MSNNNHNSMQFPEPSTYTTALSAVNNSQDLILDEFRKLYVISHTNPDNQEYQQQFANATSNVDQLESKLFTIGNDVESIIETMNKSLFDLNTQIEQERARNANLQTKMETVDQQYTSANGMISEYKQFYNMNYLRNWGLLLSIVLCVYAITIIRIPAKSAYRVSQNNFQQTALLSLLYNIIMFIPCLIGDLLGYVRKMLQVMFSALAYIPCLLTGKIE